MLRSLRRPLLLTFSLQKRKMSVNVQEKLTEIIAQNFEAVEHLDIINESSGHNVPKGSQTHFKIVVVSDRFRGMILTQRHRLMYSIIKPLLRSETSTSANEDFYHRIHALSLITKTTDEWAREKGTISLKSPPCLGGETRLQHQAEDLS